MEQQQKLTQTHSEKAKKLIPTQSPYYFVGPTPMESTQLELLLNDSKYQQWLNTRYNLKAHPAGEKVTPTSLLQRSFRSEVATKQIIPDMFRTVANALELPKSHRLTQVNGGGHQAGKTIINNILVPGKRDNVYVDSGLGGAFRNNLTLNQINRTMKRYFSEEEAKNHIITKTDGINLPSTEELEKHNIKFFFGTANETSTAQAYSEKDWKELRKWKEASPKERFIILDITSAVGATLLSKNWDIIDAAFFPPQKAMSAPAETGFIVVGPYAQRWMESVQPSHLNIDEELFPANPKTDSNKLRLLKEDIFFDPNNPDKKMEIINSVNLKKFVDTTMAAESYIKRGGEKASIERGNRNLSALTKWIAERNDKFAFFTDEAHRSLSVGIIDIIDKRFKTLPEEKQDQCLSTFHNIIGDQGSKGIKPLNIAYDIKTFPTTPLSEAKRQEGTTKIRAIRFWLNIPTPRLEQLLPWVEKVYEQALDLTLHPGKEITPAKPHPDSNTKPIESEKTTTVHQDSVIGRRHLQRSNSLLNFTKTSL